MDSSPRAELGLKPTLEWYCGEVLQYDNKEERYSIFGCLPALPEDLPDCAGTGAIQFTLNPSG